MELPIFLQPLKLIPYFASKAIERFKPVQARFQRNTGLIQEWLTRSNQQAFGPLEQLVAAVVITSLAMRTESILWTTQLQYPNLNATVSQSQAHPRPSDAPESTPVTGIPKTDHQDTHPEKPAWPNYALPDPVSIALFLLLLNVGMLLTPLETRGRMKRSWEIFWPPWQVRDGFGQVPPSAASAKRGDAQADPVSREAPVTGSEMARGAKETKQYSRGDENVSFTAPSASAGGQAMSTGEVSTESEQARRLKQKEVTTQGVPPSQSTQPRSNRPSSNADPRDIRTASGKVPAQDRRSPDEISTRKSSARSRERAERQDESGTGSTRRAGMSAGAGGMSVDEVEEAKRKEYLRRKADAEMKGKLNQPLSESEKATRAKQGQDAIRSDETHKPDKGKARMAGERRDGEATGASASSATNDERTREGPGQGVDKNVEVEPAVDPSGALIDPATEPSDDRATTIESDPLMAGDFRPLKSALKKSKKKPRQSKNIHHNYFMTMRGHQPHYVPFPHGYHPPPYGPRHSLWWKNVPKDMAHVMVPPPVPKEVVDVLAGESESDSEGAAKKK